MEIKKLNKEGMEAPLAGGVVERDNAKNSREDHPVAEDDYMDNEITDDEDEEKNVDENESAEEEEDMTDEDEEAYDEDESENDSEDVEEKAFKRK